MYIFSEIKRVRCLLFLLRSGSKPLDKGGTVNFSLFERKVTKEANNLAGWPQRQSTVPQGLICSQTYGAFRGTAPVPESKAPGISAAAPILQIWLARWCVTEAHHANRLASRRRDANARWFVGRKVEICFLRGYGGKREFSCHWQCSNSCLAVLLKASHSRGRWRANGVTVGVWYTYMIKTVL